MIISIQAGPRRNIVIFWLLTKLGQSLIIPTVEILVKIRAMRWGKVIGFLQHMTLLWSSLKYLLVFSWRGWKCLAKIELNVLCRRISFVPETKQPCKIALRVLLWFKTCFSDISFFKKNIPRLEENEMTSEAGGVTEWHQINSEQSVHTRVALNSIMFWNIESRETQLCFRVFSSQKVIDRVLLWFAREAMSTLSLVIK